MTITNAINLNANSPPLLVTVGGTGVQSPAVGALLIGNGSSAMTQSTLAAGELLIGTGAVPASAQLTAQDGMQITSASGSISLQTTPNIKASAPFNFLFMGG